MNLLRDGFGAAVGGMIVLLAIAVLIGRQLLLAHGGDQPRAMVARRPRVVRALTVMTFIVIALRLAQLFSP
jgi:hypothetical protein